MFNVKFNNNNLQQVVNSSQNIIKKFHNNLDKVSEDIKQMDLVLHSLALPFSYCFKFKEDETGTHYIFWKKDRLLYKVKDQEGKVYTKPLLESKADERLACWPYLADFYKNLVEKISEFGRGFE